MPADERLSEEECYAEPIEAIVCAEGGEPCSYTCRISRELRAERARADALEAKVEWFRADREALVKQIGAAGLDGYELAELRAACEPMARRLKRDRYGHESITPSEIKFGEVKAIADALARAAQADATEQGAGGGE